MSFNLAALERKMAEEAILREIPDMSPDERASKVTECQTTVDQLASEVRQATEAIQQIEGIPDYRTVRPLAALVRKHRSAQKSLERLQDAIAKAEKAEQRSAPQITFEKQQQSEQE